MLNDLKNRIKYETERPNIDQYWILFNSTGWNKEYKFSIEELETAIEKSWYSISVYINQVHGYGGKSFSVTIKKDFQFYIDQNLLAERSSAKSSHEAIMKELGYDPNNILKIPGGSKIPKEGMHDLLKGRSENM